MIGSPYRSGGVVIPGNLFAELRRRNVFRVAGVYAVVGWLLAQAAVVLEAAVGLPGWFDGFIVAVLLIGFPLAMILAWAFEMTPEGVKLTAPLSGAETAAPARKLDYAILAGIALVLAASSFQQATRKDAPLAGAAAAKAGDAGPSQAAAPAALPSAASIAVLPFTDLSAAKDQEYFSDGISEEILNVLVRVNGLKVASRTSSFQFKHQESGGIRLIAAQLGVRHVVEGSVRKSGDTIRITAQLIDARDDRHLWSETFDRPLTAGNIFEIQDEIASAIVDALRKSLGLQTLAGVKVAPTTDNVAAYELFLRARALFQARTRLDEADRLLARALEQDPRFAKAWELRAAVYNVIDEYGYSDLPRDELDRLCVEYAQKALAIDPKSATAIASLANIRSGAASSLRAKHDLKEVIADFHRALAIEPRDGSALNWLGLA